MRVSINLSEEMLQRVDLEAKRLGTSRGAMLTTWIGEKVANLDLSRQFSEDLQAEIQEALGVAIRQAISDKDTMKSLAAASEVSPIRKEKKRSAKS